MKTYFKKIVLVLIVLVEILIGWLVYRKFSNTFLNVNQIFVASLKKENFEFVEIDDFKYFYDLKPNIIELDQPEWLEEKAVYTYNNDGLNERFNYEVEKPENVFRIITLGDSFTFGIYVNTYENWSELLEDALNSSIDICPGKKFEVINLGVSGYDVPYIVKRFKLKGVKYNPDLIVWLESGEGFYRFTELMEPLISDCKKSNSYSEEQKQDHSFCWNNAVEKVKKEVTLPTLREKINSYFEEFFSLIKPNQVIFFGFEKDLAIQERKEAIYTRKNKYPDMDFRITLPDIFKSGDIFLDNHPNKVGQQKIEQVILDSIKADISKNCNK